MVRIAFQLDRTAITVLGKHAAAGATPAAVGGVLVSAAGHDALGWHKVWDRLLYRSALASRDCHTSQGKPRESKESPPIENKMGVLQPRLAIEQGEAAALFAAAAALGYAQGHAHLSLSSGM